MLCMDGFNYEIQDNSKFLNINTNKIWQIITVYFIYKKNDLANNVPYKKFPGITPSPNLSPVTIAMTFL